MTSLPDHIYHMLRFNRYMVECECIKQGFNRHTIIRFNRYMVECECVCRRAGR